MPKSEDQTPEENDDDEQRKVEDYLDTMRGVWGPTTN